MGKYESREMNLTFVEVYGSVTEMLSRATHPWLGAAMCTDAVTAVKDKY